MIIDCDVHPTVPGMNALMPYLDPHWRETVVRRGVDDQTTISYPTVNPLTFRSDWKDETDWHNVAAFKAENVARICDEICSG